MENLDEYSNMKRFLLGEKENNKIDFDSILSDFLYEPITNENLNKIKNVIDESILDIKHNTRDFLKYEIEINDNKISINPSNVGTLLLFNNLDYNYLTLNQLNNTKLYDYKYNINIKMGLFYIK